MSTGESSHNSMELKKRIMFEAEALDVDEFLRQLPAGDVPMPSPSPLSPVVNRGGNLYAQLSTWLFPK